MQPEIKEEIARLAASFIQEGDTILLDGSTTVAKIVPFLRDIHEITVITNSIAIAHEIAVSAPKTKLYVIGGLVRNDIANAISTESLLQLKELYVDKVFIGACSISANGGLSTPVIEEAPIKKAMLGAGREIFIMADSSKFGQKSLAQFGTLKPEYAVITDDGFSQDMRNEIKDLIKKGLRIMIGKQSL
jgi:DeoR/GlpR family transcriptional regulator of sugar metabolism